VLARTERIWLAARVIDPVEQAGARVHFSGRHMLCRPLNRALRGEGFRLDGEGACRPANAIARWAVMRDYLALDTGRALAARMLAQIGSVPCPV
jgi:hypothetical protein